VQLLKKDENPEILLTRGKSRNYGQIVKAAETSWKYFSST
jgi:hypothetical protein